MSGAERTFEERRRAALDAAKEIGIVDVVRGTEGGLNNLEALELAIKLMREHGPQIYKDLAEHCRQQEE